PHFFFPCPLQAADSRKEKPSSVLPPSVLPPLLCAFVNGGSLLRRRLLLLLPVPLRIPLGILPGCPRRRLLLLRLLHAGLVLPLPRPRPVSRSLYPPPPDPPPSPPPAARSARPSHHQRILRGGDMAIRTLAHQKPAAAAAAAAGGGGRKAGSGSGGAAGNRILVTVNVLGSAGPIRFVTSEGELVAAVIGTALRSYAREGRLPVLGSDHNDFLLFCSHSNYMDALNPSEPIGANGGRNFVLCKKQLQQVALTVPNRVVAGGSAVLTVQPHSQSAVEKKGGNGGSWKAWLNKSFNFKISSH
ncbi:hypothetical protein Taro_000823, partial [Colocasia esculenta]|nr:hypothetical protein [Colocasia esculenta]